MTFERKDRVQDTTQTTGTGAFVLDAATIAGFRSFGSAHTVGATLEYFVGLGSDWEAGLGTLTDATHLTRTTVLSSSNGGSLVNFGAGSKTIFETVSGAAIARMLTANDVPFAQSIPLTTPGSSYMPQTTVAGALTFTPAANAVRGALVYLRLVADGANTPSFAAFKEWGGSSGYDNRNGIVNQVQFFHDGVDSWFSASQAVGAVPLPAAATAVTLTGPTTGVVSTASTNFTVGVTPVGGTITGTVVVTASSSVAGDTVTPSTINVTNGTPSGTFTVTGSTTGARTISVTNNGGLSNPAGITYTATAAATAPGAPTIGTATAGDSSASVAFTAPASNGGSAILDYTVTSSSGNITATGTASPINVTGLTNGTAYTFTVKARNGVGSSAASAASNSVTPAAAAATSLRYTNLASLTESGTDPNYTYTGMGTAFNGPTQGGLLNQSLQAGVDGWLSEKITAINGGELLFFVTPSAALQTYLQTPYALWASSSGYKPFTSGSNPSPTTAVAVAVGDIMRMRRTGSNGTANTASLIGEVSKDNGATWATIYTWTGVSTGALHFQSSVGGGTTPFGSFANLAASGLA